MPALVKKVRAHELQGQRVVDADGLEVELPQKRELPKPPQRDPSEVLSGGLVALADAMKKQATATNAQLLAIAESQQKIAAHLAKEPPEQKPIKRWTIKVRRESGLITDMTATPEK